MERDNTAIEVAIKYVLERLASAQSHDLIDNLTDALSALLKAKQNESAGFK